MKEIDGVEGGCEVIQADRVESVCVWLSCLRLEGR